MSFRLSPGTLEVLAGVYAPPRKHRPGSGGGKGGAHGASVALRLPKPGTATGHRADARARYAFGGGSHEAVSRRATATLERTARGVPEVMVRVTGRQHGAGHLLANFSYIARLGHGAGEELGLHTSDGDVIRDGRDMQVLAQDWHEWEMGDNARRAGATSISMILSMPAGTDPERVKEAALAFAGEEFANRSWVASLHVDRDHPHVHLTFARRDHDGRRFHPNRDDLFRYRQRFAEKLRDRGIEANATPARARGIDPAHEPIAARKLREKGEVPRVDLSRAERVERLREQGLPDPVQAVLAERQAAVRAVYERSVVELSASPSLVDQHIASSMRRFAGAMPVPEPNSARAARARNGEREAGARPGRDDGVTADDALTAAIARFKAAYERSQAAEVQPEAPDGPQAEQEKRRPSGISDRLRALMEEADRQSAGITRSQTASPDGPRAAREEERPSGISDRLRSLMEEAKRQSANLISSRADEVPRPTQERVPERPSGISDRLRSLMEEAKRQSTDRTPSGADEILREMRDHVRQQREERERLEREREQVRALEREQEARRPSGVSDRLRSLMDEADRQSAGTATKGQTASPAGPQPEREDEWPSGISDRLRELMEEASRQSANPTPNRAHEILREALERDWAPREHDRSRDRDGPSR